MTSFGTPLLITQNNAEIWPVAVLALPEGRTAVAWTADGNEGVFVRFFNAENAPEGPAIRVTDEDEIANRPALTVLANGNLIVTYTSLDGELFNSTASIRAKELDLNGNAQGPSTLIFTDEDHPSSVSPDTIALQGGGFVTLFMNLGLDGDSTGQFLRAADSNGEAIGNVLQVANTTSSFQTSGSIAALNDGGFVVAFDSRNVDNSSNAALIRFFDATGVPRGNEIRVNQYTTDRQGDPDVTVLNDGRVVVVWDSDEQDGSGYGVYARIYAADGTPQTGEFRVNTTTANDQENAVVEATPDGGFLIAWTHQPTNSTAVTRFQQYDTSGTALGPEGQIEAGPDNADNFPVLSVGDDGVARLAWLNAYSYDVGGSVYWTTAQLATGPTDGDDEIKGTQATDMLYALAGDDLIEGGFGDDVIDGGAGLDTALFNGARSEYDLLFTTGADRVVVSDQTDGRDDTDTLLNVERAQFTDGTLAFDTAGKSGEAYRLYQAAFDRTPDDEGLTFWINAYDTDAVTLVEMAAYFIDSSEFETLYGTHDQVSENEFLTLLYNNVLNRNPDQAGFDFWAEQASNGVSRAEILQYFSESTENVANVADDIVDGIWYGYS